MSLNSAASHFVEILALRISARFYKITELVARWCQSSCSKTESSQMHRLYRGLPPFHPFDDILGRFRKEKRAKKSLPR